MKDYRDRVTPWILIASKVALPDNWDKYTVVKPLRASKLKYKAPHANRSGDEPWRKK